MATAPAIELEDHDIAAAIAAVCAALAAVLELVRRARLKKAVKEELNEQYIHDTLDEIKDIVERLDDVLNHPNDTEFGVGPIKAKLDRIEDSLKEIRRRIHD